MKAIWSESKQTISADELNFQGVFNARMPIEEERHREPLAKFMKDQGYVERDQVDMLKTMPNYEAVCHKFVVEHLHTDDEVRFVLSGAGVWEVRSKDDKLMRVEAGPQDLIVVPANRYHFFYLTDTEKIQCVRLFKDRGGWTPLYRKDLEAQEQQAAKA